ncbi:unnamed protein product [Caenorhabditis auriculariae]|uniref:non-specific serine/threonine protein kinase n=1 Tax=Caenorhabditis auriculariae TaxID=2777116 RepID=A0A8S1HLT3_9PELO|nr:unnamed protein product [Caenorhabditis auriculariae]
MDVLAPLMIPENADVDTYIYVQGGHFLPKVKPYVPKLKAAKGGELLKMGTKFRDRYYIQGLIGRGGYGQIYYGIDTRSYEEIAIKTEPTRRRGCSSRRMFLEQRVLYRLQGRPHVPTMLASGHTEKINFIMMQLLSVNVGDLKKQSPVKRLSRTTTARIILQGVAALRDVHSAGFLHRDVKPANMCFGITQFSRHVLKLVDYGLVRRYKNADGTIRKPRTRPGFRGTLRYVSVRVHDRMEQCPADDLVSMVYSGVECLLVDLPWKLYPSDEYRRSKLEFQSSDSPYLALTGVEYCEFSRAVFSLNLGEEPDYGALQALLTEMVGDKLMTDAYDWEENYRECIETSPCNDANFAINMF